MEGRSLIRPPAMSSSLLVHRNAYKRVCVLERHVESYLECSKQAASVAQKIVNSDLALAYLVPVLVLAPARVVLLFHPADAVYMLNQQV